MSDNRSSAVCHADYLSEDLKQVIRDELIHICYGGMITKKSPPYFINYRKTAAEFLERYENKSPNTKTGIMGELLAHIFIRRAFPDLSPISALFNKEDRSVKKGFDLNYYDNQKIWCGEVKSSKDDTKPADIKNIELLNASKKHLQKNLNSKEDMLWHNAMTHAAFWLTGGKLKSVAELLSKGVEQPSVEHNALLVSVLFRVKDAKISRHSVEQFVDKATRAGIFGQTLALSIQKDSLKQIEHFFCLEARRGETDD